MTEKIPDAKYIHVGKAEIRLQDSMDSRKNQRNPGSSIREELTRRGIDFHLPKVQPLQSQDQR